MSIVLHKFSLFIETKNMNVSPYLVMALVPLPLLAIITKHGVPIVVSSNVEESMIKRELCIRVGVDDLTVEMGDHCYYM